MKFRLDVITSRLHYILPISPVSQSDWQFCGDCGYVAQRIKSSTPDSQRASLSLRKIYNIRLWGIHTCLTQCITVLYVIQTVAENVLLL